MLSSLESDNHTNKTEDTVKTDSETLNQSDTQVEMKVEEPKKQQPRIVKPFINPMRNGSKVLNSPTDSMFSPATQKIEQKRNHLFKKY